MILTSYNQNSNNIERKKVPSHLVTRIVRDSILDGPGCRYVVFVKGCSLVCPWCHNPENQRFEQEILRYEIFCIECGRCLDAVPHEPTEIETPVMIPDHGDPDYFRCVETCPTGALNFAAQEYTTDWLLSDMLKYSTIYKETGGGLTISGGEPLAAASFSFDLFSKVKAAGFHTAIDTSGTVAWEILECFLEVVDLWLYDFKHVDDALVNSPRAIDNLGKLAKHDAKIWIRIPLIPGYNDSGIVWKAMAEIIAECGDSIKAVYLLPFHPYAGVKYAALGRVYEYNPDTKIEDSVLNEAKITFEKHLPKKPIILGRSMVQG